MNKLLACMALGGFVLGLTAMDAKSLMKKDPCSRVSLKFSNQTHVFLHHLEEDARAFLKMKEPSIPSVDALGVNVNIDVSKARQDVFFLFFGDPGDMVYRIWCDSTGKITKYEKELPNDIRYEKELPNDIRMEINPKASRKKGE